MPIVIVRAHNGHSNGKTAPMKLLRRGSSGPGLQQLFHRCSANRPRDGPRSRRIDRPVARSDAGRLLPVETITDIGEPDRRIKRAVERCGATLVAMATRGRERLDRRVPASVANAVMQSTSIPCLFVRPVREHVPTWH